MRSSSFYAALVLLAFSWRGTAEMIENFTFTGNADAGITGTIVFQVEAGGTAGLSDVLSLNASAGSVVYELQSFPPGRQVVVPVTNFDLANLTSFSFYPSPDGCADVEASGPNGRIFPPADTCDFILAGMEVPGGAFLGIEVEFDPAIGNVEAVANYEPLPYMEGFHGGLTQYTVTAVVSPEPSTFACAAVLGLCLVWVRLRRAGPVKFPEIRPGTGSAAACICIDTTPKRKSLFMIDRKWRSALRARRSQTVWWP